MAEFNGWQTPDTYSNAYAIIPETSGVYLLECFERCEADLKSIGIAYVGQAKNLTRRLSKHEILHHLRREYFVRRWFKPYPETELKRIESDLIRFHNPPFNILGKRRGF